MVALEYCYATLNTSILGHLAPKEWRWSASTSAPVAGMGYVKVAVIALGKAVVLTILLTFAVPVQVRD